MVILNLYAPIKQKITEFWSFWTWCNGEKITHAGTHRDRPGQFKWISHLHMDHMHKWLIHIVYYMISSVRKSEYLSGFLCIHEYVCEHVCMYSAKITQDS